MLFFLFCNTTIYFWCFFPITFGVPELNSTYIELYHLSHPFRGTGGLPINIRYHQVDHCHDGYQITDLSASCHMVQRTQVTVTG